MVVTKGLSQNCLGMLTYAAWNYILGFHLCEKGFIGLHLCIGNETLFYRLLIIGARVDLCKG